MAHAAATPARAEALLQAGRFEEAAQEFRRLAKAQPVNMSVQRAYASALSRAGRPKEARSVLRAALKRTPRDYALLCELALTSLMLHEPLSADEASRLAMEIRPDDTNTRAVRAMVCQALGRYEDANDLVAPAVEAGSFHTPSLQVYLEVCLWKGRVAPGIDTARRVLGAGRGGFNDRRLRLVYAQLLEKAGEHDEAFAQFELVNRLRGGADGFDPDAFDALVDQIRAAWNPRSVDEVQALPQTTHQPVFIVGMPRSGSSLVERLLDRHPDVTAAGETPALHEAVFQVASRPDPSGFTVVHDPHQLTPVRADRLRRGYLKALGDHPAARVTDKSLTNFLHLGAIRTALPGAAVVHCVRNPLDTCVSCFCQYFESPMPYTQDMAALGRFYNAYRRLMSHWEEVVPPPPTEVVYEQMVEDVRSEAQRLVEAVDLPWDEACARPNEGDGYTATASRDQVRKKVYRSSVGRWKRFEKHLGPLCEALDDRYLAEVPA